MKVRRSKKVLENYVCPTCWHQVQNCTCQCYPPWSLVMIDVNIQEIIRTLNEKGYQTIGCCESHFGDSCSIYVAFPFDMEFPTLPDGFSYSKRKPSVSYMFKKNERENKDLYEWTKAKKIEALSIWARDLPENPRMFRR